MADLTLEEKVDSIFQMVKELAENQRGMQNDITAMQKDIKGIRAEMQELNGRMDGLAIDVNKNKGAIRVLQEQR